LDIFYNVVEAERCVPGLLQKRALGMNCNRRPYDHRDEAAMSEA
jgi:hypothetical protein